MNNFQYVTIQEAITNNVLVLEAKECDAGENPPTAGFPAAISGEFNVQDEVGEETARNLVNISATLLGVFIWSARNLNRSLPDGDKRSSAEPGH